MKESLRAVRDKVDLAEGELPDDIENPIVEELSFDDLPIIFFTLTGSQDMLRLREIAEEIAPQLESVPGVNRVDIFGGFEREVRVIADPALVAYHGLTLDDVARAVAGVEIDVEEVGEGPPTGAPLAIRVQSRHRSLADLEVVARDVETRLAGLANARDVRMDYDRGKPEVHVELDRARASAEYDVSPEQVSRALRAAFEGLEVGRIWVRGERVDVRVQAPERYAEIVENVREIPLRTGDAGIVPLGEVATVRLTFGENAIFRHDGLRTITVRSDVAGGESSVALEAAARTVLAGLALPSDVQIGYGGETEERDRSNRSLLDAMKWGLLLIYVIIAIQFDSIRQPLIVLMTIPLSLIGVTLGLLLTGTPFSFIVFIGVVSLTGIVVNDGIVMIDAINRKRRAGMPVHEAIRTAAPDRLRPVVLTTVTTVVGLLPLTLNVARGGEFWVPLGVAIISGLLVASLLTLFVVPVLYELFERGPAAPVPAPVRAAVPEVNPSLGAGAGLLAD